MPVAMNPWYLPWIHEVDSKNSIRAFTSNTVCDVVGRFSNTVCKVIERFSNTGRYLTAVIENEPTWILIYDLEFNKFYRLENPNKLFEYRTVFSSDDKMITFISSDKSFSNAGDYFGDIWIFKFNQ